MAEEKKAGKGRKQRRDERERGRGEKMGAGK